ncbi:TonB-dependent hemoglobin/transferrin/lactoferrin family receptor [Haemophilus haemolyticus]|jgi:tonB-dependent hemoglobin/transferrin/lactoferrin receptor family protein|uniref:TonB-dependent hemoglobin/transferrin/lactoferrin family receptor n=2 Tax=Pasteurellaceae TaxID=712 RepID=A0ABQ6SJK2_9PAST|nr:TonB-dependent hemoglobin/transferrin/lactoferrin family receptor [Haemophilus seminalis]RDE68092.1 TonB-dependent hemoglobin/transferrin/lactoferrin family receptor [Haemophilus haemolyticus]TPH03587.1 TonB-dependent hemoglobin/transferrin/lactoferrin family receptor [Haemophilus haemolyticus]TPH24816.1 TonB-dependent hemoglobin/transferrin/lactoferrin family receptor [Haemophilus haemolyticus]UJZ90295.1 TonB-dependent hemoglobin/transferrin/lactoferrin family receptor [Haemophilus seminali
MKQHKLTPYALLLITAGMSVTSYALAEEQLSEIKITDEISSEHKTQSNVIRTNAKTIQQEMIRDTRDLVRYTTDVGISDNGRFLKGFSIRGVEGNRVGISVDGVNLPDSEENSLYSRYGNFNPSRLSIDSELVRDIDIVRGSDALNSGSGALGGSVNYHTLDAQDIVKSNNKFGALLRGGYASKNSEWVRTLGLGYVGDKVDAVLMYSQRTGHEIKSRGEGPEFNYTRSQHPDPATHRFHSYLAKVGYQITPHHKVGVGLNGQKGSRYVDERSYTSYGSAWREADDQNKRINVNAYYLYTPESNYLAFSKLDFDYQKTDLAAVNYKGQRDWLTNEKQLSEVYDRRMKTVFKRISAELESMPFNLGGEHVFSFRTYASEREFKNINHDTNEFGLDDWYTIQRPVKTRIYGASLKDQITWNPRFESGWRPTFSANVGTRYDYAKLSPKALNAACSKACLAEGEPAQSSFSNWSGFLGLDAQTTDTWKFGYQLSTGYRIPTATELYFSFTNAYGTWKSNPGLKSERSINHTVFAKAQNEKGIFDVSLYQTRYRDFLFEQESIIEQTQYGRTYQTPVQQMVNVDNARVHGVEVKGSLNLDTIFPIPQGFKLHAALGYSKGKLSNSTSLLSIQPIKAVLGLDYEDPNGKWGIFSRLTYLGSKKAKDAKTLEIKDRCVAWEYDDWTGEDQCSKKELYQSVENYKYLNKSTYLVDLFGFYKIKEAIILRAGVYNLFDKKYHTWDALRGINAHSTTNNIDRNGVGLERFYAPGRNFSASVEIRF